MLWLQTAEVRAEQTEDLLTLRNTMVGMLEKLVASGVISEEEARAMVDKAESEALAEADRRREEDAVAPGTVRVTYVPQVVKDEIRQEVREELRQEVTRDVIEQARTDGWGVPGAMPAWITDIEWRADMRVRGAGLLYDDGNSEGFYRDFQAINDAGGIGPAGQDALLNVSENREGMQARLRFGMDARVASNWLLGMRFATGNEGNPVTRNVTAGDYDEPWDVYVDLAYAHFKSDHFLFSGGRFPNPFLSTDLVFDEDVTFEGLTMTGVLPFAAFGSDHRAFATVGAFPLEEVELSDKDKYLFAAQLGGQFEILDATISVGAAYYDFYNIEGERNEPESVLLDFTAPGFLQKGNTLFDIRNDLDPNTGLFALAGDYDLVDFTIVVDSGPIFSSSGDDAIHLTFTGDYVTNVGFDSDEVLERTGAVVDEKTDGYQLELALGNREIVAMGDWRVASMYKHLERDAVLDAFTDSDFHGGGTDAEGWVLDMRYGIARNTWMRFRYLTANEIDGPPLGIDVVQLDLNTKF
jgi:hypothetical protein